MPSRQRPAGSALGYVEARDRAAWHRWLERHHRGEREAWLVFHKKHTGVACVSYEEAVEEALCFGWIDSIVRRIDGDRYAQRFTPRRRGSSWSELNRWRVARLVAEGRMREAGMAAVEFAIRRDPGPRPRREPVGAVVPAVLVRALAEKPKAEAAFAAAPPSQRRNMVLWIEAAKRDETRQRRAAEVASVLERGERLGMK